jgi:hypothetical protein
MSDRTERLGTVIFAAAHVAAYTLLGMTVYDEMARTEAVAVAPDTPLAQPDPPPAQGAA